jgi:GWxTD domain-containing protein
MKGKLNNIVLALLCLPMLLQAAPEISLEVYRYKSPDGPFIEVSMYVAGPSLTAPTSEHNEYGVTYLLFIKNEQGDVVAGGNYKLSSTGTEAKDIVDIKRFAIPNGKYTVTLEAVDISDALSMMQVEQVIDLTSETINPYLSDLQLVAVMKPAQANTPSLNKSGLYLEPLPFRLYYASLNQLYLYHEIYMADQIEGQPYLQYTIRPASGDIPVPIVTYKKLKKEAIQPNVFQLDITSLISGPYILETKLFDGNKNEKAVTQIYFSRLNPAGDSIYIETAPTVLESSFVTRIPADSLDYNLRALAPVVTSSEVDVMNVLLKKGNDKAKRFFLHRYYTQQAGKHAGTAHQSYMRIAKVVDETFRSGFGYGFETDRGHIFLKYGLPDDVIEEESEPSAPPYEIWTYHDFPATHQSNVRFLFYNPSLSHNAFRLLHSTAIGEVRNDRWEVELYRDATLETPAVGAKEMCDNVYRNARRYFEN